MSGQIKGLEERLKRLEKRHGTMYAADSGAVAAPYSGLRRDPDEASCQWSEEIAASLSNQPGFSEPVPSTQHPAKSHRSCGNQHKGPASSSQTGGHGTSTHSTSTMELIERLQKRSQEVLKYLHGSHAAA